MLSRGRSLPRPYSQAKAKASEGLPFILAEDEILLGLVFSASDNFVYRQLFHLKGAPEVKFLGLRS
jgi:hypothetical protein